jgi:hypothetical protein
VSVCLGNPLCIDNDDVLVNDETGIGVSVGSAALGESVTEVGVLILAAVSWRQYISCGSPEAANHPVADTRELLPPVQAECQVLRLRIGCALSFFLSAAPFLFEKLPVSKLGIT